jgi:hypothetical protein
LPGMGSTFEVSIRWPRPKAAIKDVYRA